MEVVRRSANYKSSLWTHTYLQSLTSVYGENKYKDRAEKLKEKVKTMLKDSKGTLNQLELIDVIQRLGVCYHFEDEIYEMLKGIFVDFNNEKEEKKKEEKSLYLASLLFRLLRQHGYLVLPQDAFKDFIDEFGMSFKTKPTADMTKGILNMYEASFLAIEGENILDVARDFAVRYLKLTVDHDPTLGEQIRHALELPFHWGMLRVEATWHIHFYEKHLHAINPVLLEFAKLDFNILQALYIEEIKDFSRWNTSTRLTEKLSFARNRMVECYFWMLGLTFEPQFGYARQIIPKLGMFATVVDDIYDVYGTLAEIRLFTEAIKRWDVKELEQLPSYMRDCFLLIFNLINELVFHALKEQDVDIGPSIRKTLLEYCELMEVEAKWYNSGYKPSLDEFLESAWITVGGPFLTIATYFAIANPITKQATQTIAHHPSIVRWPNMILRLVDDLATSSEEIERGDVPKSIQCYMHDKGASEEEARKHVNLLISETWKKLNKDLYDESPFSKTYIRISMNMARASQCVYQIGDGFGNPTLKAKERMSSVLFYPIPM